jgi:ubiquinone/menaquinone biosynthesis C-methylase UbiE
VGTKAGIEHHRHSDSSVSAAPVVGSLGNHSGKRSFAGLLWQLFDRYVGRGSYHWLRERLDPQIQYSQLVYAALLKELVTTGTRWLDAGCGHQTLEVRLHQDEQAMVNRAELAVGCDVVAASIRRHRSLRNRAVCRLQRLPFGDHTFNLVTLNMVAEHLERPEDVIAELARVVVPNGLVVIHTPNAVAYQAHLTRLVWRILPRRLTYGLISFLEHRQPEDVFPTFYRANSRQQLRQLSSGVGLVEQQVQMVFERPVLYFFAPLSALEMVSVRLFRRLGLAEFCASTILGVYRNPGQMLLGHEAMEV